MIKPIHMLTAASVIGLAVLGYPLVKQWSRVEAARIAVAEYRASGLTPEGWATKRVNDLSGDRFAIIFDPFHPLPYPPKTCDPLALDEVEQHDVGVVNTDGKICGPFGRWMIDPEAFDLDADSLPVGTVVVLKHEASKPPVRWRRSARDTM